VTFDMKTAGVFLPLLKPARYKGAYGGRGSGKSHFMAGLIIEDCLKEPSQNKGEGLRVVCIREQLQDLKESAKLLIEDELQERPTGQ
jgi:phage terminase large subunit